jgi:hypothetical protein
MLYRFAMVVVLSFAPAIAYAEVPPKIVEARDAAKKKVLDAQVALAQARAELAAANVAIAKAKAAR